jgi:hypothetical protein
VFARSGFLIIHSFHFINIHSGSSLYLKMGLGAVRLFFAEKNLTVNVQKCTLFRIMEAYFVLAMGFLSGLAGGFVSTVLFTWRFLNRCTKLEWAVGDLQARLSTFKGRDMAEKRWSKKEAEDVEMAQILRQGPKQPLKYDNDPLG